LIITFYHILLEVFPTKFKNNQSFRFSTSCGAGGIRTRVQLSTPRESHSQA